MCHESGCTWCVRLGLSSPEVAEFERNRTNSVRRVECKACFLALVHRLLMPPPTHTGSNWSANVMCVARRTFNSKSTAIVRAKNAVVQAPFDWVRSLTRRKRQKRVTYVIGRVDVNVVHVLSADVRQLTTGCPRMLVRGQSQIDVHHERHSETVTFLNEPMQVIE